MARTVSDAHGDGPLRSDDDSGSTHGVTVVDCDRCAVRGLACHDCVITVLLGPPPDAGFDVEEQRALAVLAGSGLVPRLRMVEQVDPPPEARDLDTA